MKPGSVRGHQVEPPVLGAQIQGRVAEDAAEGDLRPIRGPGGATLGVWQRSGPGSASGKDDRFPQCRVAGRDRQCVRPCGLADEGDPRPLGRLPECGRGGGEGNDRGKRRDDSLRHDYSASSGSSACSLTSVSASSAAGSEPATMPTPA